MVAPRQEVLQDVGAEELLVGGAQLQAVARARLRVQGVALDVQHRVQPVHELLAARLRRRPVPEVRDHHRERREALLAVDDLVRRGHAAGGARRDDRAQKVLLPGGKRRLQVGQQLVRLARPPRVRPLVVGHVEEEVWAGEELEERDLARLEEVAARAGRGVVLVLVGAALLLLLLLLLC